jgi:hypothetical protein
MHGEGCSQATSAGTSWAAEMQELRSRLSDGPPNGTAVVSAQVHNASARLGAVARLVWTTTGSAEGESCFLAKKQSWRTAWRARSLLSRTTTGNPAWGAVDRRSSRKASRLVKDPVIRKAAFRFQCPRCGRRA